MTPLLLVAGFLGAGKTTFLKALMPALAREGMIPHVIINDYGNALIDALALEQMGVAARPITGSCICCSSRDQLMDTLAAMPLAAGDVVIIEANGTTDTVDLLESLALDERAGRLSPPVQVTVVDAQRWQRRHWNDALEMLQFKSAGYWCLGYGDVATLERCAEVRAELAHAHPGATEVRPADLAPRLRDLARVAGRPQGRAPRRTTIHDAARHHFAALTIQLPAVVRRADLQKALADIPDDLLRLKGVAVLADDPGAFHLFQKVGGDPASFMRFRGAPQVHPVAVCVGGEPAQTRAAVLLRGLA